MSKRIKKVFRTSDQVIHLWANQSQEEARCKNVYFEGTSVYSYGSHYELGRLIEYNGKTVAVINDSGYSVTTGKHISSAWHAVAHMPRIKTEGDFSDGCIERGLLRQQQSIIEDLFNHFNKRSFWKDDEGWSYDSEYGDQNRIDSFNALCTVLGFDKLKLNVSSDFIDFFNEHVKIRQARQLELDSPEAEARREAGRLKRAAKEEAKLATDLEAWKQGGSYKQAFSNLMPQRIRIVGETVQTTRGAEVPLSHALLLLRRLSLGIVKAGTRIGHFQVSSLDTLNSEPVIKIGCHIIAIAEAKAVLELALSQKIGA